MRKRTGREFFEDPLLYARQANLARLIAEEQAQARTRYLPTRERIYFGIREMIPFLPENLSHRQIVAVWEFYNTGNRFDNQQQIYHYLASIGLL